jgi:hypothetical protein
MEGRQDDRLRRRNPIDLIDELSLDLERERERERVLSKYSYHSVSA